eukprot:jgi/Mesvir1/21828/Mv04213-RA.1
MSKRLSTQRSLAAALSNENTPAAPAAASPTGQTEGSGATSQALVVAHPPAEPASPAASPEPKRSRPDGLLDKYDFDASQPGFFDKLTPDRILGYVFFGTHASLIELCKQLSHQGRLVNAFFQRRYFDKAVLNARAAPTFSNSPSFPSLDAPSRSFGPQSPSPPP